MKRTDKLLILSKELNRKSANLIQDCFFAAKELDSQNGDKKNNFVKHRNVQAKTSIEEVEKQLKEIKKLLGL